MDVPTIDAAMDIDTVGLFFVVVILRICVLPLVVCMFTGLMGPTLAFLLKTHDSH